MQLGHLLTRSGLTYPEVSSEVYHDTFCQLDSSVSLPWVIYFGTFYIVVSSFSCIPVICPKLVLFLTPLQFVHLFCNLSQVYPAVLLMYFISAAVILLPSLALTVQVSLPYNKTGRASILCSFIVVFLRDLCGLNTLFKIPVSFKMLFNLLGTTVAQWLRCCATIRRSLVRSQLVSVDFLLTEMSTRSISWG